MKALRKTPRGPWRVIEVGNTLEALQEEVGGCIEAVGFTADATIICNEEGKLLGLQTTGFFDFVGTILIVGIAGEEFTDVPKAAVEYFCR